MTIRRARESRPIPVSGPRSSSQARVRQPIYEMVQHTLPSSKTLGVERVVSRDEDVDLERSGDQIWNAEALENVRKVTRDADRNRQRIRRHWMRSRRDIPSPPAPAQVASVPDAGGASI